MAEKGICKKTLTCESVTEIIKKIDEDLKHYSGFLMDHVKEHEGILSNCYHREDYVNKVSELIEKLEEVKEFMKSHVHVIDETNLTREQMKALTKSNVPVIYEEGNAEDEEEISFRGTPGRRKRRPQQKPIPVVPDSGERDSGVGGSTTSQDLKGKCRANSSSSTASSGYTDLAYSATERNISSCSTYDDNLDRQDHVKCRSKQLTKRLAIDENKNEQHNEQDYNNVQEKSQTHPKTRYDPNNDPKDDPGMNKDDNRKSH